MSLSRKPQATRRVARSLSISTHIVAFIVACVVAALAFGLPLDKLDTHSPDAYPTGLSRLEQSLELPDADKTRMLDPNWTEQAEHWHTVTIEPGDTLAAIFKRLELDEAELYALLAVGSEARNLERLQPGQIFRLHIKKGRLQELVYDTDRVSGMRFFRDADVFKIAPYTHRIEKRISHVSGTISDTLGNALRHADLSRELRGKLQQIFARRIDFATRTRPGDTFTVLHEAHYFTGEKIGDGEILAAELVIGGETYRAVGFPDSRNRLRYYTPDGHGLEPAFIRYPLRYTKVSSPFSINRVHPVLGVRRPHTGIDLAAPKGTPVRAPGDGVVEFVGWQRGYGKTVIIDHGRGYTTLYAHLSSFAEGLEKGDILRRGEVLAHVGSTGLSTGPHLHYEVHVNGEPRDPATVALPGDPPIPEHRLAAFKRHADPLLAQVDLLQRTQLALQGD